MDANSKGAGIAQLAIRFRLHFSYTAFLSYGCLLASRRFANGAWSPLALPAELLAWGQVLAGFLDCVENGCLLHILTKLDLQLQNGIEMSVAQPWPMLAAVSAGLKFFLLGLGFLCLGLGIVRFAMDLRTKRPT